MKNYLALIRKADFTDLFKYGRFHINNDMKTDFQCSVEELPEHPELFMAISHYANAFDNAFSYLIIHYTKESTKGLPNDLYIEDVKHIYPLDFESKSNLEFSFDERIRIEEPIWSEAVLELQKHMTKLECKKGAHNIHQIIGFGQSDFNCEDIINDDIINEFVDELYEDRRPKGDLSIWVYLLRYERHAFYPQNILGCFMDMVNVVCNRLGGYEASEQEVAGTNIYKLLDLFRSFDPSELQFNIIYSSILEEENGKKFLELVNRIENRVDFIKTTILFMFLRNRYTDDFKFEPKIIDHCKKLGVEFELASYLFGIVLGHIHTYDCLYEKLPLAIFKEKVVIPEKLEEKTQHNQGKKHPKTTEQPKDESSQATEEITKEPISPEESENGIQEGIIVESRMNSREAFPTDDVPVTDNKGETIPNDMEKKPLKTIPSFPCVMAKLRKDGTPYSNCTPITVTSPDMYFKYEKKGWKVLRKKNIEKGFFD